MPTQEHWYARLDDDVVEDAPRKRDLLVRLDARHPDDLGVSERIKDGLYRVAFEAGVYTVARATIARNLGWL